MGKVLSFKPRVGKVQTGQTANGPNHRWIYYNFPYIILVFSLLSPTFHSLSFLLFSIRFSSFQSHPASPLFLSSSLTHTLSLTMSSPCHASHLATPHHASSSLKKKPDLFSLSQIDILSPLFSLSQTSFLSCPSLSPIVVIDHGGANGDCSVFF